MRSEVLLMEILSGKKVTRVLVESARAVARSATVAEQAWKLAKENGVQIVAAEIPTLFKANANPGETLMRRELCRSSSVT